MSRGTGSSLSVRSRDSQIALAFMQICWNCIMFKYRQTYTRKIPTMMQIPKLIKYPFWRKKNIHNRITSVDGRIPAVMCKIPTTWPLNQQPSVPVSQCPSVPVSQCPCPDTVRPARKGCGIKPSCGRSKNLRPWDNLQEIKIPAMFVG